MYARREGEKLPWAEPSQYSRRRCFSFGTNDRARLSWDIYPRVRDYVEFPWVWCVQPRGYRFVRVKVFYSLALRRGHCIYVVRNFW